LLAGKSDFSWDDIFLLWPVSAADPSIANTRDIAERTAKGPAHAAQAAGDGLIASMTVLARAAKFYADPGTA
jgi:hypothetical protein